MIGLTLALLAEMLRNARISMDNACANARRRRLQRDLIRQEMSEYEQQFPTEEHIYVHNRVDATLTGLQSFMAPQYEQDAEEPRLTPEQLLEELHQWSNQARDMGIPFIVGAQVPGYTRIYMSSNITPAHTDTQILCAYHDLSR